MNLTSQQILKIEDVVEGDTMQKNENVSEIIEDSSLKNTKINKNISHIGNKFSMEQILKDNLSCEMFHFHLNVFYSPHFILKFILLSFILLAYCLASYMTITLILNFLEYNVITTFRTVNETPTVFPKVTICNRNIFTSKHAYDLLVRSNYTDLNILNRKILKSDRSQAIVNFTLFRSKIVGQMKNFTMEQKEKLSHSLNETLLSCLFDYETCNETDFQWEWDTYYGNCYNFNSGFNSKGEKVELRKTFIDGSNFGLHVEFYVNFYEELMFFNSVIDSLGLLIRIDNISHVIDYLTDGISISPGYQTNLALNRQFRENLPKPYSNCDDFKNMNYDFNYNLYNLISQSKYVYTQKFCLQQCLQNLFVNSCNCCISDSVCLTNASICSSESQLECAFFKTYKGLYLKSDFVQKNCLPQCPLECKSSQITYTSSSSHLLPKIYINLLKNNPSLRSDFINRSLDNELVVLQSIVKLNIFYDSLSYTTTTESPQMDVVSLIANIGGNLGLFMGVCLFSLGEMVVTLIELIFLKFDLNKKVNPLD
jgi:hypothetical protein